MTEADHYPGADETLERIGRLPATAPDNPPSEFRGTYRPDKGDGWPPTWGPNPYSKAPRRREGGYPPDSPPEPCIGPERAA